MVTVIIGGVYFQGPDSQRVDPLGSWMDFVKRPVGNFPAKCRKRKRPLVKHANYRVNDNSNRVQRITSQCRKDL